MNITREQIMAAQGCILDIMVAEGLEIEHGNTPMDFQRPAYHASRDACAELEAEIERRGLIEPFMEELKGQLLTDDWSTINGECFKLVTAPAEARARAFCLAMTQELETKEEGK